MSNAAQMSSLADKPHILVVDDDERLRQLLFRFLNEHDFLVTTAVDAKNAREILKYLQFDLIVLDVMMPDEDGMALTQSLKAEKFQTPILLLTALGEVESRIQGFEAGADDYLGKPFEPRELLLRMHAILRRVASRPVVKSDIVRLGEWILDLERGELVNDAERLPLTQAEQTLLKALVGKKGDVVSREELCILCGINAAERTIDVQITRLRKKIEPDQKTPKYIQTIRGKGYILWLD
jgi:two-component system phosphate regulon response regulator OmpR